MRTSRLFAVPILVFAASFGQAQSFAARETLPANPRGEPFTFTIDGTVYLGSGGYENDFYKYEPENDHWTSLGTLPGITIGRGFAVSFVIGDKAYVCLGRDGNTMRNDLWEYDHVNNHWTQRHDFPGVARMGAFAFAAGGKGYVGGGTDLSYFYGDFYSYDPVADAWSPNLGALPTGPVVFASGFTWNGEGYLMGGGHDDGSDGAQLFRYDAAQNHWVPRASFTGTPREAAACFVLGDNMYFGLGQTQFTTAFNDLYAYDLVNNAWTPAGTFPGTARGWTGVCSTGSRAFLGLGWDLGNVLFNDWWEYTPAVGIQDPAGRLSATSILLQNNTAQVRGLPDGQVAYAVHDATGRTLRTGQLLSRGGLSAPIGTEEFTTGVYLLQLENSRALRFVIP